MSVWTGQAGGLRFLHQRSRRRRFAPLHKGGRPPPPPPPPYTQAPCWLKVSLSLKLRCRAPQLPPAALSGPKSGQGRNFVKKIKIWKVLRTGLPIVENLIGLNGNVFSLLGTRLNSCKRKMFVFHQFSDVHVFFLFPYVGPMAVWDPVLLSSGASPELCQSIVSEGGGCIYYRPGWLIRYQ